MKPQTKIMYTLLHYPSEHLRKSIREENAADVHHRQSFIVSNSYNQEKLLIETHEKAPKKTSP